MFQRLSRYLPQALRRSGVERQVEDRQILDRVQKELVGLLGEGIGKYVHPVSIRNGVLMLATEKSAVAQEIQWKSAVLFERVNMHFRRPVLKRLNIVFQGSADGMM